MRKLVLAFFLTILGATGLQAQFLAFTKRPVSQSEYANAIEHNDRSILNLDCSTLVQSHNAAMSRMGSQHRVQSCQQLGSYIRTLTVQECPQGVTAGLGRVSRSGRVDLEDWRRPFRAGEQCVYDGNEALFVASLSCGNFVTERLAVTTVFRQQVAIQPAPAGPQITESRTIRSDTVIRQVIVQQSPQRRSWIGRNWGWFAVTAIAAAGGYCGFVDHSHCGMKQETTVIVDNSSAQRNPAFTGVRIPFSFP